MKVSPFCWERFKEETYFKLGLLHRRRLLNPKPNQFISDYFFISQVIFVQSRQFCAAKVKDLITESCEFAILSSIALSESLLLALVVQVQLALISVASAAKLMDVLAINKHITKFFIIAPYFINVLF